MELEDIIENARQEGRLFYKVLDFGLKSDMGREYGFWEEYLPVKDMPGKWFPIKKDKSIGYPGYRIDVDPLKTEGEFVYLAEVHKTYEYELKKYKDHASCIRLLERCVPSDKMKQENPNLWLACNRPVCNGKGKFDFVEDGQFDGAYLKNIYFNFIGFRNCGFDLVDIDHSTFRNVAIKECKFGDSVCDSVRFEKVNFENTTFSETILPKMYCLSSSFVNCKFDGAVLRRSYVIFGSFHKCNFNNACMANTVFNDCTFVDCTFTDEKVFFDKCYYINCKFINCGSNDKNKANNIFADCTNSRTPCDMVLYPDKEGMNKT